MEVYVPNNNLNKGSTFQEGKLNRDLINLSYLRLVAEDWSSFSSATWALVLPFLCHLLSIMWHHWLSALLSLPHHRFQTYKAAS